MATCMCQVAVHLCALWALACLDMCADGCEVQGCLQLLLIRRICLRHMATTWKTVKVCVSEAAYLLHEAACWSRDICHVATCLRSHDTAIKYLDSNTAWFSSSCMGSAGMSMSVNDASLLQHCSMAPGTDARKVTRHSMHSIHA